MAVNDLVIMKGGEMVGVLYPDVRGELDGYCPKYASEVTEGQVTQSHPSGKEELVCLALMGEPERGETERPSLYHDLMVKDEELAMGLVLRRLEDGDKRGQDGRDGEDGKMYRYERVGLARWMRSEIFMEMEEVDVKLV